MFFGRNFSVAGLALLSSVLHFTRMCKGYITLKSIVVINTCNVYIADVGLTFLINDAFDVTKT